MFGLDPGSFGGVGLSGTLDISRGEQIYDAVVSLIIIAYIINNTSINTWLIKIKIQRSGMLEHFKDD